MFSLLEATVKPLLLNTKVLEAAYELYLQAPQSEHPEIDLKELSNRTGASLLECRNAIVGAHEVGRFPKCSLRS
ncbi:MAG: hypothetical protein HC879_07275 [Leptolyngbyaceae cyanobacterium SL_5_9]|nr:hypothetical protein [Leptolyngbyaceae cyanobacterium SL_5_9]NJO73181.1 hypothetical protein [Leptolyngbyaceae cyanobacterium RM1_406_9]